MRTLLFYMRFNGKTGRNFKFAHRSGNAACDDQSLEADALARLLSCWVR